MVSSSTQELFYTGTGSTGTQYAVSAIEYVSADHIKASRMDAGTGTVTVVDGIATFSSAQSTLGIGSHIRISGETYTVHEKTSDTVFQLTEEVDVASSSFHLPDDQVFLVSGSTFTLMETGPGAPYVTTSPAIASTAILRIYREVPYTQTLNFPSTGPIQGENMEMGLDLVVQMIQQLATALENTGITVPVGQTATVLGTRYFADSAARSAATPDSLYQLGLQIDTKTLYFGSSLVAGGWTQIPNITRVVSDITTATPLYVGELVTYKGATIRDWYAPAIYKGTATSVGSWELCIPNRGYDNFHERVWNQDEELVQGEVRWAGVSGLYRYIDRAMISVAQVGYGNISVKLWASGDEKGTRQIPAFGQYTSIDLGSADSASATDSGIASSFIDPGFGPIGSKVVMAPDDKVYLSIHAVGSSVGVSHSTGSNTFTPSTSTDLDVIGTGSAISSDPDVDGGVTVAVVTSVRGDGTFTASHPSATSNASGSIYLSGRIFARGFSGTWAGQTQTIDSLSTTDTSLIRVGDDVIGPTVPSGTKVLTVSSTSFTISQPLTAGTTYVSVTNPNRPPVIHFTVISESNGDTVISVPSTNKVYVGDSVVGTNIPSEDYVASKTSTTFTLNAAISGGSITDITVMPPKRRVTITAGTYVMTVNHATGLLVGMKVSGPGISPDTYITEISGTFVTVNRLLVLATSGGSTDLAEFTREEIQVTGATVALSDVITLPYSISSTAIDTGFEQYEVICDEVPPGTITLPSVGTTLLISNLARTTNPSATVKLRRLGRWRGLSVSISGRHYAGTN